MAAIHYYELGSHVSAQIYSPAQRLLPFVGATLEQAADGVPTPHRARHQLKPRAQQVTSLPMLGADHAGALAGIVIECLRSRLTK